MMRNLNASLNGFYLSRALNQLAPFFHLTTQKDVSATIALQQLQGLGNRVPNERIRPPEEAIKLIDLILNSSEGSFSVNTLDGEQNNSILYNLNNLLSSPGLTSRSAVGAPLTNRIKNMIKIHYEGITYPNLSDMAFNDMSSIVGNNLTGDNSNVVEKLSCFSVNTPYVSPSVKHAELISAYLNGIPTIEQQRAVPYIDMKFISGREVVDSSGRLNSLSIFKFLQGAVETYGNDVLQKMLLANTISGSINGARNASGNLSVAGMELFTAPQTLVDVQSTKNGAVRAVPVVDPFRPFLTFKSLNVEIKPTVGLFSYKTAKIEFVLHDRSRLSELADVLRPDLYSTTEIMLEYGWMHPDGPEKGNVFADMLNFSRCREKYGIVNVSYAADGAGQINITLNLAMRGGSDIGSETIATASDRTTNILREVENLAKSISELRDRVFRQRDGSAGSGNIREIRGQQILETAGDYQNNIRLTPEIIENLRLFRAALSNGRNSNSATGEAARSLAAALAELYSSRTTNRQSGGRIQDLSVSIQDDIRAKITHLFSSQNSTDPFLPNIQTSGRNGRQVSAVRPRGQGVTTRSQGNGQAALAINGNFANRQRFVSLGKLLLSFVGVPLTATGKFDEVQFLFYPFNDSAGFANTLNISQFIVDTNYFYEQYVRFRTENINRAANVNIKDFMSFVSNTIIDDPLATVYGIDDLYERIRNRQTGEEQVQPLGNSVEAQTRLENRLRSQTPNGDFKMPQISFYIEALPLRRYTDGTPVEPDVDKTILKIHVFDKQMTTYQGQNAILQTARNGTLNSIATIPNVQSPGEPEILRGHQESIQNIISTAMEEGIIEQANFNGAESTDNPVYVISKGPKGIKDFVMGTMPYIIYGSQNSGIKNAQLQSQQVPELATVNLLRNFRAGPLRANGEQPGGLPLSIIPSEMGATMIGCSLIDFAQQFFVDFQTGTTADNIYGVNGVSHKLQPGSFETDVKFVPLDAYGKYSSFLERINQASIMLNYLGRGSGRNNR